MGRDVVQKERLVGLGRGIDRRIMRCGGEGEGVLPDRHNGALPASVFRRGSQRGRRARCFACPLCFV